MLPKMPIMCGMKSDSQKLDMVIDKFDSLGRAVFIFDRSGTCWENFSHPCLELFEVNPAGKKVSEVLRISSADHNQFQNWYHSLFDNENLFTEFAKLGPKCLNNSRNGRVNLVYEAFKDENGKLLGVLVMATPESPVEITEDAIFSEELFLNFIHHTREAFKEIMSGGLSIEDYIRLFHRIRGDSSIFSFKEMVDTAGECESYLRKLAPAVLNIDVHQKISECCQKLSDALECRISKK